MKLMTNSKRGKRIALLAGCVVIVVVGAAVWVSREKIVARYRFWRQFESQGNNVQGYPEYRHRRTGIVFVMLPGGTFNMGSPETEEGREDWEGPVHEVTLSPFLIAKYELSQAEWRGVVGDNPSHFKGERLPVDSVSWEDCKQFCLEADLSILKDDKWR